MQLFLKNLIEQFFYPGFIDDFILSVCLRNKAERGESHAPPVVARTASKRNYEGVIVALREGIFVISFFREIFVIQPNRGFILKIIKIKYGICNFNQFFAFSLKRVSRFFF